ncbi:hypothetical protein HU761_23295 [Pseudomonas sp. SWRI59]|uniref:hypothetical protein n=1 Tax=Pseudomonas TaxID=286 RepID=UPI001647F71D|nr:MULTISPECIES: hypothetical protein [unclassified Pseudomonas]MBC3504314.1 hypothetical protein [Pseudomonas sp. SWRI59]MBC3509595.1 hypothetical protein [Pseudomonas sp. SWRI68]
MEPKELEKPEPAVAHSAAGPHAEPGRSYAGILVHHGAAPAHNDPAQPKSYYVTLKSPAGEQTLWGAELEQAIRGAAVQRGQAVQLDYQGNAEHSAQATWSARSIDAAALQAADANATPQGTAAGRDTPASQAPTARTEIDPVALDALMQVAGDVKKKMDSLDPEEVRRINASLHENDAASGKRSEREANGAETLLRGTAELVGGVASLTGAAMQGLGKGADALANAWRGGSKAQEAAEPAFSEETAGRVPVLPRLSEYRVDQVEKAASNYEKAHVAFWNADNMPQVRQQIEARAEQTGLTVPEVIEKMKPDGEFTDLHETFVEAVGQSPEAQSNKKAMDKALTGWARQYGRAQEELLNPETDGSPHYDKLKNRLETSSQSMHANAGNTPAFDGEAQSHLERLKDVMQRIAERLKEMLQGIVDMVRGKPSGPSSGNDYTP